MSLESFYGGKPGVSPVIRKSFKYVSIQDKAFTDLNSDDQVVALNNNEVMESCFEKENYKDVWYGELAIIDATNRNNPAHGRLYRRVLGRSDVNDPDTAHAEYIGTLAGPAGGFPQVVIKTVKDITGDDTIPTTLDYNEKNYYTFPVRGNEDNDVDINYLQSFTTPEAFEDAMKNDLFPIEATIANGQLVSGEKANGIKYYWVDVINNEEGEGDKTALYLGFQIPYPVVKFNADVTDWINDFAFITDEKPEKPFYQENTVVIPAGVKGNSVGALRKVKIPENISEENPILIYNFNKLDFTKSGLLNINRLSEALIENEDIEGKYIWLFTFIAYGKFGENEFSKTLDCYMGDVEEIEDISMSEDGQILVKYYNNSQAQTINTELIKYITDINYNDNGEITVTYNTKNDNDLNETKSFKWPVLTELAVHNDSILRYKTNMSSVWKEAGPLSYIYKAEVDEINKELLFRKKIKNNNGNIEDQYIRTGVILNVLKTFDVDEEKGILTYSTSVDEEEKSVLFKELNQGNRIAAELYINRLKAVKVLQDLYYKDEYIDSNRSALLDKVLEKDNPSWSEILSIVRNDSWLQPAVVDPSNPVVQHDCSYWNINKHCLKNNTNNFQTWLNSLHSSDIIRWEKEEITDANVSIINFYPYENGNVWSFNSMDIDIDWGKAADRDINNAIEYYTTEELAKAILEQVTYNKELVRIGQLLFYNGHAYYYDFGVDHQWKYVGYWNDSSSTNSDLAIRKNQNQVISKGNLAPSGFYLDIFEKNNSNNSIFPNDFFIN